MEADTSAESLHLASARLRAAKTVDAAVQAAPAKLRDAATDPAACGAAATQTDEADGALQPLDLRSLCFENWEPPDAVLDFIHRAGEVMDAALSSQGDAAAAADALAGAVDDAGDDDIGCLHAASVSFVQPDDAELGKGAAKGAASADAPRAAAPHLVLPCSAVSWSCTGSMLAAGFGCQDHVGWCKHRAGVCVYNFYGGSGGSRPHNSPASSGPTDATATATAPGLSGSAAAGGETLTTVAAIGSCGGAAPAFVLETGCCVCSVAWHPERPGVLAAGTFSGEVLAWDLNRGGGGVAGEEGEEPLLARSKSDDYMHREPVCAIAWAWDAPSRTHLLVTGSSEGKVLMWSLEQGLAYPLLGCLPAAQPVVQPRFGGGGDGGGADGSDNRGGGGDSGSDDDAPAANQRARRAAGGRAAAAVVAGVASIAFPLDGRSAAAFYVGAENGGLFKCRVSAAGGGGGALEWGVGVGSGGRLVKAGAIAGADSTLPWDAAAAAAVSRVPLAERAKVARVIERHARDTGSATVTLPVMFDARPDPRALFPNPVAFSYQPHSAAVLALASSPFHRNLFASAGLDGRLCLFSALSAAPLMTLPLPSAARGSQHVSALTSVAWSRVRPMVLAAGSGDGSVYVYDLYATTGRPAVVLQADGSVASAAAAGTLLSGAPPPPVLALPAAAASRSSGGGAGRAVLAVAFNPRQRRLLAAGDSDGVVRVYKLGWRTASAQPSEELLLRRFVDSAVHDGDAPDGASAQDGGSDAGAQAPDEVNSISAFLCSVGIAAAAKAGGGDLQ